MPITEYDPASNTDRIFHETTVDIGGQRSVNKPIHIVQYDRTLPVIQVHLTCNGKECSDAFVEHITDVKVRWSKPDGKFVIRDILGMSSDKKTVYFDVSYQMTAAYGDCSPILEIQITSDDTTYTAGTSSISFSIDKNPVQQEDIESLNEYPEFLDLMERMRKFLDEHED